LNSRGFITKIVSNSPAKLLSIVAAIILFIFQRSNTIGDTSFEIPLSHKENSELVSTTVLPEKVRIKIKSMKNELENFKESDISAFIDLSKYKTPGLYNVPVEIRTSANMLDFETVEITVAPRDIHLTLDKKASKYVSVNAVYKGKVAPGFELVSHSISPREVYVEGPESILNSLSNIPTEQIDIAGRDSNVSRSVLLGDIDPVLSVSLHDFQFHAEIKSIEKSKELDNINIDFINLPPNLKIDGDGLKGFVIFQANELLIENYVPAGDVLVVDCKDIEKPGEYHDMPVTVNIQSDVYKVLSYEPKTVSITVKKVE
jgi:YbbR domain-containing protein